jgi:hypothetical protein
MLNMRIGGTLALVFLAGVATGMVGMRYGLHEQIHGGVNAASEARESGSEAVVEYFRTELRLSDDQTQKLAVVLDDYQRYYQSVEDQIEDLRLREQIEDLRSTGKNRIIEILNPEQRDKFEKMSAQMSPAVAP